MRLPSFIARSADDALERVGDITLGGLKAVGDAVVDAADAAVSEMSATISSLKSDFRTQLAIDRTEPEGCTFQYDLDGVSAWSNQSVVHGDCTGYVDLDHEGDDYELHWEAGSPDSNGWLNHTSLQFSNETERRGATTYRDATLDGDAAYPDPHLRFREGDKEYTVPDCMWDKEC